MGGLFSPATIEQVRSASEIVEVIGSYLPLKRAGANFVTLCPFHKEKTPSFNVNPQRQIFHCFGCHKGGDVFTFVQHYESITFAEAVRRLAERARIPIESAEDPGADRRRFLKETLLQIQEGIAQRWQNALANDAAGQVARDYLQRRGVTAEAVRLFRLGYAPDAWDDTVNWARSKGYDLALVEQAGLILRKEGTDRFYDRFRGRLIFPIGNEQGRVIGFSGRVLTGDNQTAKYVNSPETPIFTKGKVFYGLDKAKQALLEAGAAVICEGQLDLIACYMAGVRNVVAPQGTAFTPDHARILKRYVDEVILCFDSDTAGQAAAVRVQESLLASGLAIRVATLPAPHDPDSFIRAHGGPAFQALLARAQEFFDFYLDHLCATLDVTTDKGQMAVVRAMAGMVQQTGADVLIDKYAQKTAMRLARSMQLPIGLEAMRAEFRKGAGPRRPAPAPAAEAPAAPREPPPSTHEFWLLRLLLLDEELLDWAAAQLDLAWVQHPRVRAILAARLAAHAQGHQAIPALLTTFEDLDTRSLITAAVTERRPIPERRQQLLDVTRRLRDQFLDRQLQSLMPRLSQPDLPEAERLALLEQQQALRLLKKQPLPS
jgi:DNA primase